MASEAFCPRIPTSIKPVEENTLPSWLWQHHSEDARESGEGDLSQIFHRAVGSATYAGWKKELFPNETAAKIFYDEMFWLLAHRFVAIEPILLSNLGIDWAYGLSPLPMAPATTENATHLTITNQSIDTILSDADNGAKQRWHEFLNRNAGQRLSLRFNDTTNEWGAAPSAQMPRLALDLTKFLREDDTLNIGTLQQAVRYAVFFLEMHYEKLVATPDASRSIAVGFAGMSELLMRQGIAYDSNAGRATAAAISSVITAAATVISAQLAQQLGPCPACSADRSFAVRVVTNRRRAAYGDTSDCEHVSVIPQALALNDCPDLALVAATRRSWDDALVLSNAMASATCN